MRLLKAKCPEDINIALGKLLKLELDRTVLGKENGECCYTGRSLPEDCSLWDFNLDDYDKTIIAAAGIDYDLGKDQFSRKIGEATLEDPCDLDAPDVKWEYRWFGSNEPHSIKIEYPAAIDRLCLYLTEDDLMSLRAHGNPRQSKIPVVL